MTSLFDRFRALFFRPDVTVTADPLDPDPRTIAEGLLAALRLCATEGRPVRALVSRVPGASVALEWNAVHRRIRVEIRSAAGTRESTVSAPPFTFGADAAAFVLEEDNLRLTIRPSVDGRLRLKGLGAAEPLRGGEAAAERK